MSIPGTLLYQLYHRPVGWARRCVREGGPIAQWNTEQARREMEVAAEHMPSLPDFQPGPPMVLHLVTGARFWYQTVFCLHSLARCSQATVFAELYDDGTIDPETSRKLKRLGNRVRIRTREECQQRLDELLPEARFPALRERWRNYPNIRKLIDPHIGRKDWKMALDSDLLFFRRPELLISWFSHPSGPVHAVDCEENYGYPRPLLERLAGAPVPALVNVGACALRSEAIDWERLESWCATLIGEAGTNYYLEQALIAMLMAREPDRTILPAKDYITMPGEAETRHPTAVMHHYVSTSKRWYFQHGWRHVFP